MDKYKVKINPRAILELDSIYEYIANEKSAPENAKRQIDKIKKAILIEAVVKTDSDTICRSFYLTQNILCLSDILQQPLNLQSRLHHTFL